MTAQSESGKHPSLGEFLRTHTVTADRLRLNQRVVLYAGDPLRPETLEIQGRGVYRGLRGEGAERVIVLGLEPEEPEITATGLTLIGAAGMSDTPDAATGLFLPSSLAAKKDAEQLREYQLSGFFIADGEAYARWSILRGSGT